EVEVAIAGDRTGGELAVAGWAGTIKADNGAGRVVDQLRAASRGIVPERSRVVVGDGGVLGGAGIVESHAAVVGDAGRAGLAAGGENDGAGVDDAGAVRRAGAIEIHGIGVGDA